MPLIWCSPLIVRFPLVWRRLWAALCLLLACVCVDAQDVLPVPVLSARIVDTSGTLSAQEVSQLAQQLAALEQRSGTQLVVLLVPSTAPEDIFSYANRVANTWKIGRKAIGDGLLIVLAEQDRRVRIEVAKTLEGAVPDLAARQIIERHMTPAFKRGDYAGGLRQAIEALGQRITGEYLPAPRTAAERNGVDLHETWSFGLVGLWVLSQVLRRAFGRGWGAAAASVAGASLMYFFTASVWLALGVGVVAGMWTLLSGLATHGLNAGWGRGPGGPSGWGGGGWGGGGFGSGGGGDFGGGGASGRW